MTVFDYLDKMGINYNNKDLIRQAFIHSSYANEHKEKSDNERLEFMGDAVIQIYSADRIFNRYLDYPEGKMTYLRAKLVCEETLALVARNNGLNEFLLLGEGEKKSGGKNRDSLIADMFEAFVGAIYLDSGINNAYKILDTLLLSHLGEDNDKTVDYKTHLQEYVQADSSRSLEYRIISQTGPSNNPTFIINVIIDGLVYGQGEGHTKKEAEKMAAKDALNKLVK